MNVVTAILFYVKYHMQTVIYTIKLYIQKNYVQTFKNNGILPYDTTITMMEIMTNKL
jgi:GR25 family glycosyltransferase involved in LPS biosynthesis